MIRTYTDEIRNETFYYDTKRRRWVELEDIICPFKIHESCEGCKAADGCAEYKDDNFNLEDEDFD